MTPDKLPGRTHEKKGAPTRVTTRLAIGTPAALGMLLLAGAVALGHTSGFFAAARNADADAGTQVAAAVQPTEPPAAADAAATSDAADELALALGTAKREHDPDPAAKPADPEPDPTPKPESAEPAPTPKPEVAWQPEPPKVQPTPQPAPPVTTGLSLNANLAEHPGKVVLTWSAFSGNGFGYYKLVRSHDAAVTWPPSGDDELIGAFGSPGETWAKDRPQCGVTVHYAVFAVSKGDYGYTLLAPSNVASAAVQCPPPPPPTSDIGFQAGVVDGAVHLAWGACASEHFNAYKVVRSQTNPNPTYPENEGTQLIAAIGDAGQTSWVDVDVASGQTWFYRVFARADAGGGSYIACHTQAVSVTIP